MNHRRVVCATEFKATEVVGGCIGPFIDAPDETLLIDPHRGRYVDQVIQRADLVILVDQTDEGGFRVLIPGCSRVCTTAILRGGDDDEIFFPEFFENCLPT
jgi:hypothetical protein